MMFAAFASENNGKADKSGKVRCWINICVKSLKKY